MMATRSGRMLKGRATVTARIVLMVSTILVTLALVEGFLRLIGYERGTVSIQVEDTADARAFHVFDDEHFQYDPTLIWRPRPGQPGFNRQGFRGPVLAESKPAGQYRIFAIGDSNTLGWAGNDGANWPRDLQLLLDPSRAHVVVVNAGVWGYASLQGVLRFRETLAFDPDLVLISFGGNDAHQVRASDREYAEHPMRRSGADRWLRGFRLGQLALAAFQGAGDASPLQPRVSLDEYRANLEQIVEEARVRDVDVALLTRPYNGPIDNPRWWKNWGADYNAATVEVARKQDVTLVDVYSFFKGRDELFADESHFTDEGHRLAAELIFASLQPIIMAGR